MLFALESFDRQPIVVGFLDRWSPADPAELDAIRAELRGLGAVLVVVADDGLFVFRPDDDVERFAEQLDPKAVAETRAHFGLRPCGRGVFVVDGERRVRWQHVWRANDDQVDLSLLRGALCEAGRAVVGREPPRGLSRRELVLASLAGAFAFVLQGCRGNDGNATAPATSSSTTSEAATAKELEVTLDVNGAAKKVTIDPRTSLLDALRERMALPGTKKGCDHGQCGACTVLMDGRRVKSCLIFALAAEGSKVQTIEGLASGDQLHPLQDAFIVEDGLQCGYCTPGQIMSAVALLDEGVAKTDAEVREMMSGNICRCGAYTNIVAAIQRARKEV